MCSKTDSEVTYCTEVEEMLAACDAALNKTNTKLPLRRSQRLSQKLVKSFDINKNISSVVPSSGVPLDLCHKSKESSVKTSHLEANETISVKNYLGFDDVIRKDIGKSKNIIYKNQSQQSRISPKKVSRNKVLKKETRKTLRNAKGKNSSNRLRQKKKNVIVKDFTETLFRKTNKKVSVKPSRLRNVSKETIDILEDMKLSEVLNNVPVETDSFQNPLKQSKRGRKRKYQSGKIDSDSITLANNKENAFDNHIEFPGEIKINTKFNVNSSVRANIQQFKDIKPTKLLTICKTSNKIKSTRVLRSQNANATNNVCRKIITNSQNQEDKFKMEKLTPKSVDEALCQCKENKLCPMYVQHEHQCAKFETQLHKEIDKKQNTLSSLQSQKSIVTKNYIKSFDKNQFLDKIRKTQSSFNHLPVANNNLRDFNTYAIPPSPAESSEELLRRSILFKAYPAHFKYQLPPEAIHWRSLDPQPLPTPDETISSDLLDSSSSSPSLPESLCDIFKTTDIKDILDLKRTSYHLNSYHIQALALILNLKIEYLLKILDKVLNTTPTVLKNIEKAIRTPFVPDDDLFSNSSNDLWASTNVVPNSQSP